MNKLEYAHKITVVFLMFYTMICSAQNDLNALMFRNITPVPGFTDSMDFSTIDDVFDTVTLNESIISGDVNSTTGLAVSSMPTNVSGYAGIDMVLLALTDRSGAISVSQADALIEFVKQGGILMAGLEDVPFSGPSNIIEYLGENLFCPSESIDLTISDTTSGSNPSMAYHPSNGILLLTGSGAAGIETTRSYDVISGAPAESSILLSNSVNASNCNATSLLEFIVPAYPGNSDCGIDGFAIISGESSSIGPFSGRISGGFSSARRDNSLLNQNYAQLMFDFLYDPSAMATRLAWASDPANTNTSCPPMALSCNITDPGAVSGMCNTTNNDLEFSLNLTGINIGTTYTVSGIAGITPTTGTYGTPTMFSIPNGSDSTNKTITITDDTDGTCTRNVTITGVATCFSCDSGTEGPRFLGLSTTTWGILTTILVIGTGIHLIRKH